MSLSTFKIGTRLGLGFAAVLLMLSVTRPSRCAMQLAASDLTVHEILEAIEQVPQLMGHIGNATHEQTEGTAQVGQALMQRDAATPQNAALVEQSAAAADGLNPQARQRMSTISRFKLAPG